MSVTVDRCDTCGALVDLDDLFCANCGTEVPDHSAGQTARLAIDAKNFQCKSCGASMNYDARAQSLKCPFCGSLDLVEDKSQGILAPECVIPFAIDRNAAESRLRSWLGSSIWHPTDLRQTAQLTELRAVYVPFWIFDSHVATHWTADTNRTPPGARADWYPVAGWGEREYQGVWIPASAGIPTQELNAIWPFDVTAAVPPDKVDLVDITVEQFTVSRRYARPHAQSQLEALEAQAVAQQVPGSQRNVHVNVLMDGASSQAALAPLFVLAYRYRDRVYRFVVNGQTGRSAGKAPVSKTKVAAAIGIVVLIVIVVLLIALR
ncbi:MAG TPA: hypothetical protein VGZ22_05210 [Isosphaeraceae bacterium]|jgi:predicted RNA-binding Zn-ribbon protein involved in translation (DUF1610 family)|nr:hypothetical protein [Isosphaeraceae bacterium]